MDEILASWHDGVSRQAIVDFVRRVSTDGAADYVAPEARVAVFDNDGTLWCEKPLPVQAEFLLRRVGEMAAQDPSLLARQPWKAVAAKDYAWLDGAIERHYHGDDSDLKLMAAGLLQAYSGTTIEQFQRLATEFLYSARHPRLDRLYLGCTYLPMIELLDYLRAHGFAIYIATGGGRDFVRQVAQELYGVAPQRVIGSSVALEYQSRDGHAEIVHTAGLDLFDDGPAKPVRIWSRIGRRPIFAAGNSNGDIEMLDYCACQPGPSLSLLLSHDDGEREYAYTAGAERAMGRAGAGGWTVVRIARDWRTVFAP